MFESEWDRIYDQQLPRPSARNLQSIMLGLTDASFQNDEFDQEFPVGDLFVFTHKDIFPLITQVCVYILKIMSINIFTETPVQFQTQFCSIHIEEMANSIRLSSSPNIFVNTINKSGTHLSFIL